jgi:hypothetical protein
MADPSIINCSDQIVIRPRITRVEGQPILAKTPSVVTQQGVTPVIEIVMRDSEGRPVNLTGCGFTQESSSSSSEAGAYPRVVGRLREAIGLNKSDAPIEIEAYVTEPESGTIRARLPQEATNVPAILRGQWAVMDAADSIVFMSPFFVFVERSEFGPEVITTGVPNPSDIRVLMRDNSPEDNYLLSELEFDLTEIVESTIRCVDYFNGAQPPIPQKFNTVTFPNQALLSTGIMGHLYQIAAKQYRRNHLPYSAGGVQVDDKNKSQEYEAIAKDMLNEYYSWVRNKKAQINSQNWNGSFGSGYSGGGRYR